MLNSTFDVGNIYSCLLNFQIWSADMINNYKLQKLINFVRLDEKDC